MSSRSKGKGTSFESQVVGYLREQLGDERIERRTLSGANDRGDVSGLTIRGRRAVVECKNCARTELAAWMDEAEAERGNDGAEYAFVVHKRRGCGDARFGMTYVTCDLDTLCAIAAGGRDLTEKGFSERREARAAARERLLDRFGHDG